MIETTYTGEPADQKAQVQHWSQQLQRRIIRLLLLHDPQLLRQQFRLFFAESNLPTIPLLQQYDRYIKFQTLSDELLDFILPNIRRQLSMKTNQLRQTEDAPTRGDIDWHKTLEKSWRETPGMPPQRFETRRRQHSMDTPENVLTVALIQAFRRELQRLLDERLDDEDFHQQEKQFLVNTDERAERELAAPYARLLAAEAQQADIALLIQHVSAQLRSGPNPYRELLNWWQRFSQFRTGRAAASKQASTLSTTRTDEKTDAWLYELWITLELIHLLQEQDAIQTPDITIATDLLQCTFTWHERRFRLLYNRQLDTMTGFRSDWAHGPSSRPDYTIEREKPLEIRYQKQLIWREPSVIFDAKYYLGGNDPAHTHGPIKKMLGDMTLLGAQTGALFFPQLPEPAATPTADKQPEHTRVVRHQGKQYQAPTPSRQIYLYHLAPSMPFDALQQRLKAILDLATDQLPERSAPVCSGIWLDSDTTNAAQQLPQAHTILCPKPHIGPGVYNLVNADSDCLQNPHLCHVIGQPIVAPSVLRARTHEELTTQSAELRQRSSQRLQIAEQNENEEFAEQIRTRILSGVGHAVERYVQQTGNTKAIEEKFAQWIFGSYWNDPHRGLEEMTRHALVSGEYVWEQYQEVELQDWAAPAIQYCRALEHELKRRLYFPCPQKYNLNKAGFTLGTIDFAYQRKNRDARAIWSNFEWLIKDSDGDMRIFEQAMKEVHEEKVKENRNLLAHGGTISKEIASSLRTIVIGTGSKPGILSRLAEQLFPAMPTKQRH